VLRTGEVLVDVRPWRDRLLSVKHGGTPWPEVTAWAGELQDDLAAAAATTRLPETPATAEIDQLLFAVRERGSR
jgi:uncharacterized protein